MNYGWAATAINAHAVTGSSISTKKAGLFGMTHGHHQHVVNAYQKHLKDTTYEDD